MDVEEEHMDDDQDSEKRGAEDDMVGMQWVQDIP